MYPYNITRELELLRSPDHFWDEVDDESPTGEGILDEAIWLTGILNAPEKTRSDWASSLDAPTYYQQFPSQFVLKVTEGDGRKEQKLTKLRVSRYLPKKKCFLQKKSQDIPEAKVDETLRWHLGNKTYTIHRRNTTGGSRHNCRPIYLKVAEGSHTVTGVTLLDLEPTEINELNRS